MEHEELNRDRQQGEDLGVTAQRRELSGARRNKIKETRKQQSGRRTQERMKYSQHLHKQEKEEQRQTRWKKEEGF